MAYELVAGDGGSTLVITMRDSVTDAPIDLTGKTITLRYALNGGATVQKVMTPLNQATNPGQAQYTFVVADLTAGGELNGEVRLQAGLSDQLTTVDNFRLGVKTALP